MNYILFFKGDFPDYATYTLNNILTIDKEAKVYLCTDNDPQIKNIIYLDPNDFISEKIQSIIDMNIYMNTNYQNDKFDNWRIKWQKRLTKDSKNLMELNNPVIIPRNHNVENVLKSAENNDLTPFNDLLQALKNPYTNQKVLNKYQSPPPKSDEKYQTFCGT